LLNNQFLMSDWNLNFNHPGFITLRTITCQLCVAAVNDLVLLVNGSALLTKSLNQKTKRTTFIQLLLISFKSTDVGNSYSVVLNPLLLGQNLPVSDSVFSGSIITYSGNCSISALLISTASDLFSISFLNKLATY